MSEFSPLSHEKPKELNEPPFFNVYFDESFGTEKIPDIRHKITDLLSTNADLQSCVGCPLPEGLVDDIRLSLAELLSNAHRPEAGRHATGVYVWAKKSEVGIGVGDDSDTTAGEDGREQTSVLPPQLGAKALDAYDEAFSFEQTSTDKLHGSGLGGSILALLAERVSYMQVSEAQEHGARKIIRADFRVALPSDTENAA